MVKVLISDKLSPRAKEIFEERGIEVDVNVGLEPAQLKEIIGQYDGLAIRSATTVTADLLESAENLKVVGRAGIGTDNVDKPAATQRGVVVMNTPFGNSITTAEHAVAMMMAVARQIPQANESTHQGKWEKSRFMGVELFNKTLGLIGSGNIGSIVADRAQGLKMKVVAFDPFLSPERAKEMGVKKVEMDELLSLADFITIHTPLTDGTRNMINKDTIAKMKDGVRIINCARGGIINEADLLEALNAGKVAGAALDVFEEEPAKSNPLFGNDKVVCTPHLGAASTEAQENVAIQVAEQMADYLLTGAVTNALNIPSVSAEDAPKLKPYMILAEQLGSFAGQLTESGIKGIRIEFEGQVAGLNTKPLVQAVLAGLLRPMTDCVNMVNAPVIARERSIDVAEVKNDRSSDYHTLIRLVVTTERMERSVSGTLFGGDKPRIVEIKGIGIEAELTKHMLYTTNQDKPGLIGELGTILAKAGANIATFHLGRAEEGGDALSLIQLDAPIDEAILKEIRDLPLVSQSKLLHF
ncbi:phosphoglycerate dehydrogenase [Aestuariispira insulae]|uniref:D-3-phosphoglycerate dehydrogenase n=1 Tax=Aestuariispira insulae TaxID=1461337 RepID=A0A3D9HWD4_9PROT|nr:phosphoglycerate dehydrogenase [Aestuariispira insulae]RED53691.1 D-3-phosphoglycerate dehydrogenase [Aestuariispira insulae]